MDCRLLTDREMKQVICYVSKYDNLAHNTNNFLGKYHFLPSLLCKGKSARPWCIPCLFTDNESRLGLVWKTVGLNYCDMRYLGVGKPKKKLTAAALGLEPSTSQMQSGALSTWPRCLIGILRRRLHLKALIRQNTITNIGLVIIECLIFFTELHRFRSSNVLMRFSALCDLRS